MILEVVMNNKENWLSKTEQAWKFHFFIGLSALTLALFILMILSISNNIRLLIDLGIADIHIAFAFMLIGISSLLFLFLSIKCPLCKKRPVYKIMKASQLNSWVEGLIKLEHCPFCNDTKDR
jgi:hypothetical protein